MCFDTPLIQCHAANFESGTKLILASKSLPPQRFAVAVVLTGQKFFAVVGILQTESKHRSCRYCTANICFSIKIAKILCLSRTNLLCLNKSKKSNGKQHGDKRSIRTLHSVNEKEAGSSFLKEKSLNNRNFQCRYARILWVWKDFDLFLSCVLNS